MGEFPPTDDPEIGRLDYVIAERFRAERHPEQSVDGDDRWEIDLFAEED